MVLEKIIDIAEELDWKVNTCWEGNHRLIEFEQYSPAGEDFFFGIWADNDVDIPAEVRSYANDFDEEEHVKACIGANGAPSLKELVADAESIHNMLYDLADAIEGRMKSRNFKTRAAALTWLQEEFPATRKRPECDLIDSIFLYADKLGGDEQQAFLLEMLSGNIGIEDEEIKRLCWA